LKGERRELRARIGAREFARDCGLRGAGVCATRPSRRAVFTACEMAPESCQGVRKIILQIANCRELDAKHERSRRLCRQPVQCTSLRGEIVLGLCAARVDLPRICEPHAAAPVVQNHDREGRALEEDP
jgi:hypothetical protein